MNKLLVIIYVPIIEGEYEVYIPLNKKVGLVRKLIINAISELSEQKINNIWDLKLYDNDTGSVLVDERYVKDSNLITGTKLVLI